MKFIISSDRPQGAQRQWRGPSSSSLSPSFLQCLLASSRRRSNLSFLNFLLISYLPRNRDHRIKRMSRRSPKCIGTQTECRPSFFVLPPCRRTLSIRSSQSWRFHLFPLLHIVYVASMLSGGKRKTNVRCILRLHKKEVIPRNIESR